MKNDSYYKRIDYRTKFIERNEEYKRFKELVKDFFSKRANSLEKGSIDRLDQLCKPFFQHPNSGAANIIRLSEKGRFEDIAKIIAGDSLSPLGIVFPYGEKISDIINFNYWQPYFFKHDKQLFLKRVSDWKRVTQDLLKLAVDKDKKTVMINVHLDHKKGEIIENVRVLLDLINWDTRYSDKDLRGPKKPRWDVYDKYLQVYDLKIANPKMEWSEIVERVLPEEAYPNPNKRGKKKILVQQTSIDKVRHYWREAKKMINEGGWRQI